MKNTNIFWFVVLLHFGKTIRHYLIYTALKVFILRITLTYLFANLGNKGRGVASWTDWVFSMKINNIANLYCQVVSVGSPTCFTCMELFIMWKHVIEIISSWKSSSHHRFIKVWLSPLHQIIIIYTSSNYNHHPFINL